jgi:hypothetical protein
MNHVRRFLLCLVMVGLGSGCGPELSAPRSAQGPEQTQQSFLGQVPLAANPSSLGGFVTNTGRSQVYFQGTDTHLHELRWNGEQWVHTDLTVTAVASSGVVPPARANSPLAVFFVQDTSGQSYARVHYLGTDHHVHQLWLGQRWYHRDLTTSAVGAPAAAPGSPLAWLVKQNGGQALYYLSADNHVNELRWQDPVWSHADLTSIALNASGPVPPAAPGSPLAVFAVKDLGGRNYPRVQFLGTDNHVHQLWLGQHWYYRDLTASAAGAPAAAPGSSLAGFVKDDGGQGLYYQSTDAHLHELRWNDPLWSHTDLTATALTSSGPVPSAAAGTALAVFPSKDASGQSYARVHYVGADRHVHQLWLGLRWYHRDLSTSAPGTPLAATESALTGFFVNTTESRLYFQGQDGHIGELRWNDPQWRFHDVSALAN